jgi:hypothetical protein
MHDLGLIKIFADLNRPATRLNLALHDAAQCFSTSPGRAARDLDAPRITSSR